MNQNFYFRMSNYNAHYLTKELNQTGFWLNTNFGFKIKEHTALCLLFYQRNFYLNYGCQSNAVEFKKVVQEWKCQYGLN